MNRYMPTPDERAALEARGWRCDKDGWWWHVEPQAVETGRTYLEAVRQANREDKP